MISTPGEPGRNHIKWEVTLSEPPFNSFVLSVPFQETTFLQDDAEIARTLRVSNVIGVLLEDYQAEAVFLCAVVQPLDVICEWKEAFLKIIMDGL